MTFPPTFAPSLKREGTGVRKDPAKKARRSEIKMDSVPQFIEAMNALLDLIIDKPQKKVPRLAEMIEAFCEKKTASFFSCNPFYGRKIYDIAQRCLHLDSSKSVFLSFKSSAEAMCLPHEISLKILETFSVGQSWIRMVERIEDGDKTLELAKYPSLFHRLALVSKAWHTSLLSLFSARISYCKLERLGSCSAEGVIRLARFCQGYFSALSLSSNDLKKKLPFTTEQMNRLLPLIPNITKIKASIDLDSFMILIHSSYMSRLESLHLLFSDLGYDALLSLQKTTALKSLSSLRLSGVSLDAEGCVALFQASFLPRLKHLDLSDNPIKELTGLPNFAQLEELNLTNCQISSLEALVNWQMPKLRSLNISFNPLNHQAIHALYKSQLGETLREISISILGNPLWRNRIDDGIITTLMDGLPNLRVLKICDAGTYGCLGSKGAVAIANNSASHKLEVIDLESSTVSDEGLIQLLSSSYLSNLKSLNISYNGIGPVGISAFEKSEQHFNSLFLGNAHFGYDEEVMKIFTTAPSTASLKSLLLMDCHLSFESQEVLANTSGFQGLTLLNLAGTNFDVECLTQLSQNEHFSNLETLDITENNIPSDVILQIAQSNVLKNLRNLLFDVNEEDDPGFVQTVRMVLSQKRVGVQGIEGAS